MKKVAVLVAIGFIIAGLVIGFCGFAVTDFEPENLNMSKIISTEHTVNEPFDSINIENGVSDLRFVLSEDGVCRVVCRDFENISHPITVENGVLNILEKDSRKWYEHIGIFWGETDITVYLPQSEYNALTVKTDTGDIEIEEISAKGIKIETSTGDITLKKVIADKLDIESDTGDVELRDSDANDIEINTSTGDVEGRLLSEKIFTTETSTGRINVPKSLKGDSCRITTDTGDIEITIKK